MAFATPAPLTRAFPLAHARFAPVRNASSTPRRLPHRYVTAASQSTDRGFRLLRSDLKRFGRVLKGDLTAILDRSLSLRRYDSAAIAQYYDARPFSAIVRVTSVGVPFLLWLFGVRKYDVWRGVSGDKEVAAMRAEQLRKLLTWAGPTYLKVGQAVGNRPDLVGVVYSNELQKLVDDVGTFDSDVAVGMLCDELRISEVGEVFEYFGKEAVASASLGQVHRGKLLTGEEVAVKIQRPTVENDAALDVYVLRKVARFARKRFKLRSDLVGIVDEFAERLWEELDYVHEADNCEKFERLYSQGNDSVYVPKVYRRLTTKRILTMEWIEGDKAPWFPKEDARRLIRVGVQCSLEQLLDKGFVHADPHGGNLLRMKDGKLCYLDFGMCVEVAPEIRQDLVAAIVRLINRDYDNLGTDFVKLGFLPPDADTEPLAPLLTNAFGDASTGSALSDLSFSRLADNLSGLAFATPIRIPVFFTLIIRSLTILEGFALQTDASFKIVDESYPYVVGRVLRDDSPAFQKALKDVLIDSDSGRIRWTRLRSLVSTRSSSLSGDRGGKEIETVTKAQGDALGGMSNRALNRVIDFALSDRGGFLREALQLELADTADAIQLAVATRISHATRGILPAPKEEVDMDRLEKAVTLAQALRMRVPELLSGVHSGNENNRDDIRKRQERLVEELFEASRAVTGSLVERNTRRLLRKAIGTIFGERREQKR